MNLLWCVCALGLDSITYRLETVLACLRLMSIKINLKKKKKKHISHERSEKKKKQHHTYMHGPHILDDTYTIRRNVHTCDILYIYIYIRVNPTSQTKTNIYRAFSNIFTANTTIIQFSFDLRAEHCIRTIYKIIMTHRLTEWKRFDRQIG